MDIEIELKEIEIIIYLTLSSFIQVFNIKKLKVHLSTFVFK